MIAETRQYSAPQTDAVERMMQSRSRNSVLATSVRLITMSAIGARPQESEAARPAAAEAFAFNSPTVADLDETADGDRTAIHRAIRFQEARPAYRRRAARSQASRLSTVIPNTGNP